MHTCFQPQELIRVGYYVANEYEEEELRENPPEQPIVEKCAQQGLQHAPRTPSTTQAVAQHFGRQAACDTLPRGV